jgi:hypothetical protein
MRHAEFQELIANLHRVHTASAREAIARLLKEERFDDALRLERHGFRAYSQSDEDGIIAEIFRRIGSTDRRFVELGVGNGLENNTLYLLSQGWSGMWVEADRKSVVNIKRAFFDPISKQQLRLSPSFITRDNVNQLLEAGGFRGEIDLVSIDIDGNDYYIFEALTAVTPRVIVIEYNGIFRPPLRRVQPYVSDHRWNGGNAFGASLVALDGLARRRGYRLVGTGILGINAFFVRDELAGGKFAEAKVEQLFNAPAYDLIGGFGGGHPPSWQSWVDPGP